MENALFATLNNAWNRIRTGGQQVVPGVQDLSRIIMQRVNEDDNSLTVMFKGFSSSLDDPETQAPMVKRFLLSWVKKYAQAQIERGDVDSFILRLVKPMPSFPPQPQQKSQAAPPVSESLVHISAVRKLNGR